MISMENSQSFEACRSMQQDLTFCALQKLFHSKGIELGSSQMKTLKLIGEDGLYTNLALLLSEQCPFTTKVAVFQGKDNSVFRDRKEFQGSILSQMDEVYQYIDFYNRTKATFSGLNRVDYRDYPEEALREAWMNCIVHRDYSFSGSTIINICENRIEFVSLGGLVPGVELSSIRLGISQSRNPGLAALFYRTHLIESYGTGLGKIVHSYSDFDLQPNFETAMGAFRVTLPNRNEGDYEMSQSILIIGAGQYGQLVKELAELCGYDKIAFLDDNSSLAIGKVEEAHLFINEYSSVSIAIGNPRARKDVVAKLPQELRLATLIHPTAVISKSAHIEEGCIIEANVVINTDAVIEKACIINAGAVINHNSIVHAYSQVDCNAVVAARAEVPEGTKVESCTLWRG